MIILVDMDDTIEHLLKAWVKGVNEKYGRCVSYDEIVSWSELYDYATIEAKKMIVNSMIKRIDVFRGYELNIELNMNIQQFFNGIEDELIFEA